MATAWGRLRVGFGVVGVCGLTGLALRIEHAMCGAEALRYSVHQVHLLGGWRGWVEGYYLWDF